jgi:hypothetical protein
MSQQGTLMREPTYFVLASLTEGPLHGYGVLMVRPRGRNSAMAATLAVAVMIAGMAAVLIGKPFTASMAEILLQLLVLAALAVPSRGSERLPRIWLRLPGLVVAVALLAPVAAAVRIPDYFTLLRAPAYIWAIAAVLAFAWIVIDARPAIGVAIFLGPLTGSSAPGKRSRCLDQSCRPRQGSCCWLAHGQSRGNCS